MIAETSEMMMMMTIIIEAFFCKSYHLNLTWTHFLGLVITEQLSLSKFGHITYVINLHLHCVRYIRTKAALKQDSFLIDSEHKRASILGYPNHSKLIVSSDTR